MRHYPVPKNENESEIDIDSLFIDESIMPNVRRITGEIITSKSELTDRLKRRGINFPRNVFSAITTWEGITSNNSTNTYQNALFISKGGVEKLVGFINSTIQDAWDAAKSV